jgi:hypothetical protein
MTLGAIETCDGCRFPFSDCDCHRCEDCGYRYYECECIYSTKPNVFADFAPPIERDGYTWTRPFPNVYQRHHDGILVTLIWNSVESWSYTLRDENGEQITEESQGTIDFPSLCRLTVDQAMTCALDGAFSYAAYGVEDEEYANATWEDYAYDPSDYSDLYE